MDFRNVASDPTLCSEVELSRTDLSCSEFVVMLSMVIESYGFVKLPPVGPQAESRRTSVSKYFKRLKVLPIV